MKRNIKAITLGVITLLSTVLSAYANIKPYKELSNKEVMTHYISSSITGSADYSKLMFADDFEYRNTANDDKFDKKAYLKHLKSIKGLEYNATQTIAIIDQTGNTTIGKVSMDFENFTRVDYMTLIQTKDGWKISKIITSYQ